MKERSTFSRVLHVFYKWLTPSAVDLNWYPDFPIHIVILHKVLDKTPIQSDLLITVKYQE